MRESQKKLLNKNILISQFNKSIRSRIIISFGTVATITIILFEIFFVVFLYKYYYGGIEQLLKERTSIASEFLNKYGEYSDIDGKSVFLFDTFLGESEKKFLVQTLNKDGIVVMDSYGVSRSQKIETKDVVSALKNQITVSINVDEATNERTMSASRPLMRYSAVDGVVRYTVSLTRIDSAIRQYTATSISAAFLLIFLLVSLSAFISQSIVDPIQKLTYVAREMGKGNLEIRATPYFDDEIGELSNTLNFMAEEIGKSDRLKRDFISSISHELRTPLTSIKGWGETLLLGDIEKGSDLETGLKIISSEADRLKDMVEELLDFSRLEAHKMTVNKKNVSALKIVKSVYDQMLPRAKGINFTLTNFGEDTLIYGDANRLRQVFINLIMNSIKFSKENPKIALTFIGKEDKIVFTIADNGIGIPEKHIEKVKEKFYKENVNSPGSGIGLAVADEIIKLHQGLMIIESAESEGTTITVELPTIH